LAANFTSPSKHEEIPHVPPTSSSDVQMKTSPDDDDDDDCLFDCAIFDGEVLVEVPANSEFIKVKEEKKVVDLVDLVDSSDEEEAGVLKLEI
jgi:hypothetical protein